MRDLKRLFALLLICTFVLYSVYSEASGNSGERLSEKQNIEESIDEKDISIDFGVNSISKKQQSVSSFWLFARMIIVLIFVVACIYGIMLFMKRSIKTEDTSDPFLRKVSSLNVAAGKSVQIVTILEHAYIIGVCENNISLIGEISDKELIDAMNLYADRQENTKKPRSFADILDIFMPGSSHDKNIFDSSKNNITDLLKRQQNRIKNGK